MQVFSQPLTTNKIFCQRWPHFKTCTQSQNENPIHGPLAKYFFVGLSHFSYIDIYIYIDITNYLLADMNFMQHDIQGGVRYTQVG